MVVRERAANFIPDNPVALTLNGEPCNRLMRSLFVQSCVVYTWLTFHYFGLVLSKVFNQNFAIATIFISFD